MPIIVPPAKERLDDEAVLLTHRANKKTPQNENDFLGAVKILIAWLETK